MGAEPSEEELKARATEALEALARRCGARGHIWMVIKGDGGKIGGCSPSLRPYGAALMDEVEKATEKPVTVVSKREPSGLMKAEKVLHTLAKTKHVELHPIVATMIQGLNEINNHKIPRVNALADPSTMPKWFPFPPAVYAPRAQKMDLQQLFHVMDVIFAEVRGNLHSIQTLHAMLDKVYKTGSCSIATRAGIDSFFEFLEDEALAKMGAQGGLAVKEEPQDDVITSVENATSETSGVGGGGSDEEAGRTEARSRKRTRNGDRPTPLSNETPSHSTVNSTPSGGGGMAEEDIDFEKFMSEEGGQFVADFEALAADIWDPLLAAPGPNTPRSDLTLDQEVQIDGSAPAEWNFSASAEFNNSGQSTNAAPVLHSVTEPNGVGHNPSPTGKWAPEWFAGASSLGTTPHLLPEDIYRAPQSPLLGNDESVVHARLHQHMVLNAWTAAGGGQTNARNNPPARLDRDDGLSESMRRDFLHVRRGFAPRDGFDMEESAMQPVMRPVTIAMARAPSFSPNPSLVLRTPITKSTPPLGAEPQARKPTGFLRGLLSPKSSAPAQPARSRGANPGAFPASPSSLATSPPPLGSVAQPPPLDKSEFDSPKAGRQRKLSGRQHSGESLSGQQSGGQEKKKLSGRKGSGEKALGLHNTTGAYLSGGQERELLAGAGSCDTSDKALRVLGLDDHGSFSSIGSSPGGSGSQNGSGSFDEEGEKGGGSKKGLARFLPKLGRKKEKATDKSAAEDSAGDIKSGVYLESSGEISPPRSDGGVWVEVPVSGQGDRGDGSPPKQVFSGEVLTPRGEDGLALKQGVNKKGVNFRQGVDHGPELPTTPSTQRRHSGPLGDGPPGDCEAFPLRRAVQRFESFASDSSLTAVEPQSDDCEQFPIQRQSPASAGLQKLMQQLSVSEGVHSGASRGLAASGKAPPALLNAAVAQRERVGEVPRRKREDGMSQEDVPLAAQVEEGLAVAEDFDEEEEVPDSPRFALGIGAGDDVDFDADIGAPEAVLVVPAKIQSTVSVGDMVQRNVSVRVVTDVARSKDMPAISVTPALAQEVAGVLGPERYTPRQSVLTAAQVDRKEVPLFVKGGIDDVEGHDHLVAQMRRLNVKAVT